MSLKPKKFLAYRVIENNWCGSDFFVEYKYHLTSSFLAGSYIVTQSPKRKEIFFNETHGIRSTNVQLLI